MPETATSKLIGMKVVDFHGEKVGTIKRLLVEGDDREPGWALVKVGPLGLTGTIVPLQDAVDEDGDIGLLYEKEHVCAAPSVDTSGERISEAEADALHRHYGLERRCGLTAPDSEDEIELSREARDAEIPGDGDEVAERRRQRARELGIPTGHEPAPSGEQPAPRS